MGGTGLEPPCLWAFSLARSVTRPSRPRTNRANRVGSGGNVGAVGQLVEPTSAVKDSYLSGERDVCNDEGTSDAFLEHAAADFDQFVSERRAVRTLWGVPITELWFIEGEEYIGTVVIRHELTRELSQSGGHMGFHVVPAMRRRGHGTRMLAEAVTFCRTLGLAALLLTCDESNVASRRVIEANGGVLERVVGGEARYWITS
jgi:predicted acetyltransferase